MSQKQYKQTKLPLRFRKKYSIDLTFHLNESALFYYNEPTSSKYLFQVKWSEMNQFLNVSCNPSEELNGGSRLSSLNPTVTSILTSHLQKAIRRQYIEAAIATSILLLNHEPIIFLRRLPIIVIEDTYLFREYPTLIWLMIYYSEFKTQAISEKWKKWLLHIVRGLCLTKQKDTQGKINHFNWDNMSHLDQTEQSLIYSLQLRKSYGGMHCDRLMLNWFSITWLNRFNNKNISETDLLNRDLFTSKLYEIENHEIVNHEIRNLTSDNFIIAGIDFHSCPWLISIISKKYPQYSSELLKETIWHASSAVNTRENIDFKPAQF